MALRLAPHSLLTRLAPGFSQVVGIVAPKAAICASGGADLARLSKSLRCAEITTRARRTF
jgi:hypothetical protein